MTSRTKKIIVKYWGVGGEQVVQKLEKLFHLQKVELKKPKIDAQKLNYVNLQIFAIRQKLLKNFEIARTKKFENLQAQKINKILRGEK